MEGSSVQYRGTVPIYGTVVNPDGPDYFGLKDFAYLEGKRPEALRPGPGERKKAGGRK